MGNAEANNENGFGQWLNSPELKELRKAWSAAEKQQNAKDDAWGDSLDYNGKSQAFRQIVKLMHKAEVLDKGSYRYAMYDIFNLDYGDGLSHYMMLHNLIHQGLEAEAGSCKQNVRMHAMMIHAHSHCHSSGSISKPITISMATKILFYLKPLGA
jgi:hypothetical protein